ncbi:MAG: nucleotidyltransferase [Acidobacteria bacterium]|nr:nucleotidyltransferase [Acidobacteriota bacterium]MBI3473081.1 nucleotidyltransferase [Candidatus Solibacter usitatus]
MTDLESAVVEVASALEALAIPYMLIGGLAVSLQGVGRSTLDADFSLWVEPERLEAIVGQLGARFHVLASDPVAFARQARVLPALSSRGVRVDLVFASLPAERDIIARAEVRSPGGVSVRVASAEDLIWMKLMSERAQDIEDATRLLRRRRKTLDRPYLESRLKELSEAFARDDIMSIYHREIHADPR